MWNPTGNKANGKTKPNSTQRTLFCLRCAAYVVLTNSKCPICRAKQRGTTIKGLMK